MYQITILLFFLILNTGVQLNAANFYDQSDPVLDFNIGGEIFSFKRNILIKNGGPILSALAEFARKREYDQHGNIFINRNKTEFHIIEHIIRHNKLPEKYDFDIATKALDYFGFHKYKDKLRKPDSLLTDIKLEIGDIIKTKHPNKRGMRLVKKYDSGEIIKGPWISFNKENLSFQFVDPKYLAKVNKIKIIKAPNNIFQEN